VSAGAQDRRRVGVPDSARPAAGEPPETRPSIAVVSPSNSEQILARDLAASPAIRDGLPFFVERGHASAGLALNAGFDRTRADVVVFAHQDVYLPAGWEQRLCDQIARLAALHPSWGVLGVAGMDHTGSWVGHAYSSGLGREFGGALAEPIPVVSVDELLIVVRRETGLRFDAELPGYHLYGTDIVQTALERGFGAFIVDAPVVHNSQPKLGHFLAYAGSYRYMQRKWRHRLPIATTVIPITRSRASLARMLVRATANLGLGRDPGGLPHPDPRALAASLGYESQPPEASLE
jgi:hypothetical protein